MVLIFTVISGSVLQVWLASFSMFGDARVPVLTALVLYSALNRQTHVMLATAFAAGFVLDSLSAVMPLGYSMIAFAFAGWLAGKFKSLVIIESPITSAFFGAMASVVVGLCRCILLKSNGLVICGAGHLVWKLIGTAIWGGLCTPLVFYVMKKIDCGVGIQKAKEEIDGIEEPV